MSNPESHDDDIVIVSTTRVACDGGGGALGHPKTYLDMGSDTSVTCKYCDREFRLDPKTVPGGHH
ncbi:zinc-finger domain-containing protein [Litorimonas sp. RW-G-Af-16]|uniref:zinc-finger domain-containing protein n=1 Tax=Litorimonas sp. RW-G-Af-16 TaxID=3241168 RepID=UPI00390CCF96